MKTKESKGTENSIKKEVNKEKEAIETLRVQLKEHLERSDFHKTMATKAQGALEVLLQLNPEHNKNGEES
jgi:hypothetical protein